MTDKSVTIWGAGFVGATAYKAFSKIEGWDVVVWDKFADNCKLMKEDPTARFVNEDVAKSSHLHLICVPTPMKQNGECFTGIVEEVVEKIASAGTGAYIVIKSTVPPGTTERLNEKWCRVFFNPEFLTEANAYEDFVELPYQIIGNPSKERCWPLINLYRDAKAQDVVRGGEMVLETSSTTAEMVKLTRNCYLATRLSFFNEIKQVCDKLGVEYDDMKHLAGLDERIGSHYNKVPGPDGKPGWSLSCLPKDLNDMIHVAYSAGVSPTVMEAVWHKNLEVRPERDWEEMEKAVKKD